MSKIIQIQVLDGDGNRLYALDNNGVVWYYNHVKRDWFNCGYPPLPKQPLPTKEPKQ